MISSFLTYGAIGLGLSLAFLTYKIISQEQKKKNPNTNVIYSTYAFIIMSIIISFLGFVFESNNLKSENSKLQKENDRAIYENTILKNKIENLKDSNIKFEKIKHTLDALLNVKGSLLSKTETISQIKTELMIIQENMKKEISGLEVIANK